MRGTEADAVEAGAEEAGAEADAVEADAVETVGAERLQDIAASALDPPAPPETEDTVETAGAGAVTDTVEDTVAAAFARST